MKKETLEEASAKYVETKWEVAQEENKESFEEGAKWQQERSYSEEEVENILIEYVKTNPTKPYRVVSWFTQFKRNNK